MVYLHLMSSSSKCCQLVRQAIRGVQQLRILHSSSQRQAVEPTYGVSPVRSPENDPLTRSSIPEDRRSGEEIHAAEPKEVTKDKAARAQEEPTDFQVSKTMPGWGEVPVQHPVSEAEGTRKHLTFQAGEVFGE